MHEKTAQQTPKISVVMNCYNSSSHLKDTLKSLFSQTFTDWELIFWDNGSKDNSRAILNEFPDPRVRYFYYEERTTLGEARNMAVSKATAPWVGFLDCDDIWLSDKLQKQMEIISEESDKLGLVYGRTRWLLVDKDGPEFTPRFVGKPLPEGDIFTEYMMGEDNFLSCVSVLFRRDLFWHYGGIPTNYKCAEDYYLYAHIAAKHRVRAVQTICCKYRLHSANFTRDVRHYGLLEAAYTLEALRTTILTRVSEKQFEKKLSELYTMAVIHCMRGKKGFLFDTLLKKGSIVYFFRVILTGLGRRLKNIYIYLAQPARNQLTEKAASRV